MRTTIITAAVLAGAAGLGSTSRGADPITVGGLLGQGYTVVGAIPSQAGPGLFLQKGATLYACFVSETPGSPALSTAYCKPVY